MAPNSLQNGATKQKYWVAPYSSLNGARGSKYLIKWSHRWLQIAQPIKITRGGKVQFKVLNEVEIWILGITAIFEKGYQAIALYPIFGIF